MLIFAFILLISMKKNLLIENLALRQQLAIMKQHVKRPKIRIQVPARKGNSHISSQSVGRLVRSWTTAINLKGRYGAHKLRKTWGYHQRTLHGAGYEILCKRYNHSSPAITMRYLGIEDKEVCELLMKDETIVSHACQY